jgi:hypothetical protein
MSYTYLDLCALIIGIFAACFFLVMLGFLIYQIYLISNGITTNECMRNKYDHSLFDEGCSNNWNKIWPTKRKELELNSEEFPTNQNIG